MMGTKGEKLNISPEKIKRFLKEESAVAKDLVKFGFENEIDILGSYLNNGENLIKVTSNDFLLTDDYPIMEYSWIEMNDTIDLELLDPQANFYSWCPTCSKENLDLQMTGSYITFLHDLYQTPGFIFKYASQLGGKSPTMYNFTLNNVQLEHLLQKNRYLREIWGFTSNN